MSPRDLRVFDPSPTGNRRRLNDPEEGVTMSNLFKLRAVRALLGVAAVAAVVAVPFLHGQASEYAGRKWGSVEVSR